MPRPEIRPYQIEVNDTDNDLFVHEIGQERPSFFINEEGNIGRTITLDPRTIEENRESRIECMNCGSSIREGESIGFVRNLHRRSRREELAYCEGCLRAVQPCGQCNEYIDCRQGLFHERTNRYYCPECHPQGNRHFQEKYIDLARCTFRKLKSDRCFGIELEVEDDSIMYKNVEKYTTFGSKHDGSLEKGVEFVSPVLKGDIGYHQIKRLCKILRSKTLSIRCGFHLHLDARDLNYKDVKKIWLTYKMFEPIILGLLPKTRWNNRYCSKIKQSFNDIYNINSKNDLFELWYKGHNYDDIDCPQEVKYHESRYCGFNLHSYFYQRTVEVRYHTGTLNFEKIINWVKINQMLIDFALNTRADKIKRLNEEISQISFMNLENSVKYFGQVISDGYLTEYYIRRYLKLRELDKRSDKKRIKKMLEQYERVDYVQELQEERNAEEAYEQQYLNHYGFLNRGSPWNPRWRLRQQRNEEINTLGEFYYNNGHSSIINLILNTVRTYGSNPLINTISNTLSYSDIVFGNLSNLIVKTDNEDEITVNINDIERYNYIIRYEVLERTLYLLANGERYQIVEATFGHLQSV